ncbi:MAG: TlpA family protein disulfide reductase [Omnitrophica bacterium]|nr:TlpA family protein disulfide reductase [Candidatus Omnitrophota bacterium]
MKKKLLFFGAFIVLILLSIAGLSINQGQGWAQNILSIKEAPDFALSDVQGKTFHLSDFKGKVILLDFWATWCLFCRMSIPSFVSLYKEYNDKGLEIIGVALEYDGGKILAKFIKEKNIPYTVLIGSEKLAVEYSAYGVPTRFLINREGKIVRKFIGYRDKEIFAEAIERLL